MARIYLDGWFIDEDGEEVRHMNAGETLCEACADNVPHMGDAGHDDDESLDGVKCIDCNEPLGPVGAATRALAASTASIFNANGWSLSDSGVPSYEADGVKVTIAYSVANADGTPAYGVPVNVEVAIDIGGSAPVVFMLDIANVVAEVSWCELGESSADDWIMRGVNVASARGLYRAMLPDALAMCDQMGEVIVENGISDKDLAENGYSEIMLAALERMHRAYPQDEWHTHGGDLAALNEIVNEAILLLNEKGGN